jgi:hypothetical protein
VSTESKTDKVCRKCGRERPIERFRTVKGKYRSNVCVTCQNKSKETMEEKRARYEGSSLRSVKRQLDRSIDSQRELQIKRARMFIYLWTRNYPFDVCLVKVNEIYPIPRIWSKYVDPGFDGQADL